jgi:hypothetical protein
MKHFTIIFFILSILRANDTFSLHCTAHPLTQKLTGWSGAVTPTGIMCCALNVSFTSGFFMPETINTCITLFINKSKSLTMTTIAKNGARESFIHYSVRGGVGEYIIQLRALATVLSGAPLNDDEKTALGNLLVAMLPEEDQIKTNGK